MAYRKIQDTFWTDPEVEEFTPEQKFFYLYLITNPSCNQIGLYEFSIGHATLHTGYNRDTIQKLLNFFEEKGKIRTSTKTKELVICKFYHYNKSGSPKVVSHCESLLSNVKDTVLIRYIYGMHTASQEEEEEEEEEEETQQEEEEEEETQQEEEKEVLMSQATASDVSPVNVNFFQIADSYYKLLKNNSEKLNVTWVHLEKIKANAFTDQIRLMVESDNRSFEDLRTVWSFLHKDDFWMKNIQSSKKLREKFDQLITQAKNKNTGKNGKQKGIESIAAYYAANDPNYKNY